MIEHEMENTRITPTRDTQQIEAILLWFRYEYPERLNRVSRYTYLGLPLPETRYAIELEAYEKENKLRELRGERPLAEIKFKELL